MSFEEIPLDGAALRITSQSSSLDDAPQAVDRSPGDGGADARLRRAFDCCGDHLYRFIVLRVGGDRHAADDLLQQTCYEAARHRRTPASDDAAQAWLFGIAKNLVRKHFRRLRRESNRRVRDTATWSNPSLSGSDGLAWDASVQRDTFPHLLAAMASLSESDQQLLLGSYFEGRSQEELARNIGVSVRAVEGRLYRARAALRNALRANLGEDCV